MKTVYCFQRVGDVREIPFRARLVRSLGSRLEIEHDGRRYMVNAGACTSRKPSGRARLSWRD